MNKIIVAITAVLLAVLVLVLVGSAVAVSPDAPELGSGIQNCEPYETYTDVVDPTFFMVIRGSNIQLCQVSLVVGGQQLVFTKDTNDGDFIVQGFGTKRNFDERVCTDCGAIESITLFVRQNPTVYLPIIMH
jgi:hypothetical protein